MKWLKPALLIVTSGLLYGLSVAPDVYLEDSAEFVASAYFLGIAHPPGYPLFSLIGKLFTWLPFGSVAFRVNLMSLVFGVLSAVILYLILVKVSKLLDRHSEAAEWLAFVFSLSFAFSFDFWTQAVVAEVYTLNTFLVFLVVYLLLLWLTRPEERYLLWMALVSGVGLTNHLLFAFILPVVWIIVFVERKRVLWRDLKFLFLFLIGFSLYLYLPLRAVADPVLNFNNLNSFIDSVNHVLRTSYHDLGVSPGDSFKFVAASFERFILNFGYGLALTALGGVLALWYKRSYTLLGLLAGGIVISTFFPLFLRNLGHSEVGEFIYRVYFFQGYGLALILGFVLFLYLGTRLRWAVAALIFLMVAVSVPAKIGDIRVDSQIVDYYQAKLASLKPESTYLLVGDGFDYDSELFVLFYLQKVLEVRTDIKVVDATELNFELDLEEIFADSGEEELDLMSIRERYLAYAWKQYGGHGPLYTSFPVERYHSTLKSVPNGYAVEVVRGQSNKAAEVKLESFTVLGREKWDLAYQDFLANGFYQQALLFQAIGESDKASESFIRAIKYDNEVLSEDASAFMVYREKLTNREN